MREVVVLLGGVQKSRSRREREGVEASEQEKQTPAIGIGQVSHASVDPRRLKRLPPELWILFEKLLCAKLIREHPDSLVDLAELYVFNAT